MTIFSKITKRNVDNFLQKPVHAVALCGVEGSGKYQVAKYIAAQTLKVSEEKIDTHPYIKTISVTGKDGIATVREAQEYLRLTVPGSTGIRRCIIVADADKLGHEAQNALLKTLEEPPEDTLIIATASDKNKLLDTVRSRLAWLQIYPLSQDEALQQFKQYSSKEIVKAWHISDGSIGLLTNILEDNENQPLVAAIEEARKVLKQSSYERLVSIDKLIKNKDFDLLLFLDATHRLLRAALSAATSKHARKETKVLSKQIKHTLYAKEQTLNNVQPKLLLTELFYSL